MAIIDSYSESNQDSYKNSSSSAGGLAQSFDSGSGGDLTSVELYLKVNSIDSGDYYVYLYSHSGTYGTSSVPDTLLATFPVASLSSLTTSFQLIEFTLATPYTLDSNTKYCIVLVNANSTEMHWGSDSSSPTHGGNSVHYFMSEWTPDSTRDLCFYVYGDASSESPSLSPSSSESPSESPSNSPSESPSESSSISPSPSPGYKGYTRGDYVTLPTDNTDLATAYTTQDETDVETLNGTRVYQTAQGQYAIHQFKDYVGAETSATLTWTGQTSYPGASNTIYFQIYNHNTTTWDTIDTNNSVSANTNFTLSEVSLDLTNYKDGSDVITCRVYQEMGSQ